MRTTFRSGALGAILATVALLATACGGSGDGTTTILFGGPPECENRESCLQGLEETYGLDNIEFQPIQEGSARIAQLEAGEIDLSLLFSTQPVIDEKSFVVLEDDEGIVPAENIVPVVRTEAVDAYGDDFTSLVDSITGMIETQTLLDLNGQVELEAEDPADVAEQWLTDNGLLEGSGAEGAGDGPTITVASFNFPESVILAEIYAQALEHNGYPVQKNLDLGSRELILPELRSGNIDFLPEYVGSALGVGFGGEPTSDTDETLEKLREAYEEGDYGVTVLEPAPGEDKNVFVVTEDFARENGVETISDLANLE